MKLYSVCHKEFRSDAVERLTPDERQHIVSYIVNENYPKDYTHFSGFVDHIHEFRLENYNPKYQRNSFHEYSAIAHLYLNPSLTEGMTHVGVLHSDIIMQRGCVEEILEALVINPKTIFCDTIFRPPPRNSNVITPPLWLTTTQADFLARYVSERILPVNMERVYTEGWIGGMAIAENEVFLRFGEFLDKYSDDFTGILNETVLSSHVWSKTANAYCFITERMWGFYLMSLNLPIKHINIIHDREYKCYTA